MQLRIPGRVWYDALDPMASDMAEEIGLPQPRWQKKGRGITYIYDNVSPDMALEVAGYLCDRATTLGSQWGLTPGDRELFHTMSRVGHLIDTQAREVVGRPEG